MPGEQNLKPSKALAGPGAPGLQKRVAGYWLLDIRQDRCDLGSAGSPGGSETAETVHCPSPTGSFHRITRLSALHPPESPAPRHRYRVTPITGSTKPNQPCVKVSRPPRKWYSSRLVRRRARQQFRARPRLKPRLNDGSADSLFFYREI